MANNCRLILTRPCKILLSFMITALLAIILSAMVIFCEIRGKGSKIRRKLLSGYSDSQILQGIGIQSAYMDEDPLRTVADKSPGVGLAQMNKLVPYHFFLIGCFRCSRWLHITPRCSPSNRTTAEIGSFAG